MMSDRLSFLAGHLIDAVRVNAVSQTAVSGQLGWLKRRKIGMDQVIQCGNIFLKISRSRIWMLPNCAAWVQWEMDCFSLLYGDRVQPQKSGDRGFWVNAMPGTSLLQWLEKGQLTPKMMTAAGQIFCQAHCCHSQFFQSGWSHGDSHLANVLYDAATGQAALIDFETQHWRHLSPIERQADDLLIFLLDILGRCENWAELLPVLFQSYDRPAVLQQLHQFLIVPTAWERLLWATRSNYLSTRQLQHRIMTVRSFLHDG
jgi:hypothetical protein